MTIEANIFLGEDSLRALSSLIGQHWRLTTGERLPERPRHHFAWDTVIVATDAGGVRVTTAVVEQEFEGYDEEYVQLSIHRDLQGLAEAQQAGHILFHHAGETINGIYLIRVTITQIINGESTWTYSTDYGVVFALTKGAAAICKASHHLEALDLTFADSVEALEIDNGVHEWDCANEPGEEYAVVQELIPVE